MEDEGGGGAVVRAVQRKLVWRAMDLSRGCTSCCCCLFYCCHRCFCLKYCSLCASHASPRPMHRCLQKYCKRAVPCNHPPDGPHCCGCCSVARSQTILFAGLPPALHLATIAFLPYFLQTWVNCFDFGDVYHHHHWLGCFDLPTTRRPLRALF